MSDGLSQSDLDALFADLPDTGATAAGAAEKKGAPQETSDGISQSDLDALFAELGGPAADPAADTKASPGLAMSDGWEPPPETSGDKGEILSQDEIDKMLAMYGSGG